MLRCERSQWLGLPTPSLRLLVAVALLAVAACGAVPATAAPSGTAASGTTTRATSAPSPDATGAPLSPPASAASTEVVAGPFDLLVPTGWNARAVLPNPSGNGAIEFLGPGDLPSECTPAAGGGGVCGPWPVVRLGPGGLVVAVRQYGMPGSRPPAGGQAISVAALPARVSRGPADAGCSAIGGSISTTAVVPSAPGWQGWFSVEACIAGPDTAAAGAAFAEILSSAALAHSSPEPSE